MILCEALEKHDGLQEYVSSSYAAAFVPPGTMVQVKLTAASNSRQEWAMIIVISTK